MYYLKTYDKLLCVIIVCVLVGGGSGAEDSASDGGWDTSCVAGQHTQRGRHTHTHNENALSTVTEGFLQEHRQITFIKANIQRVSVNTVKQCCHYWLIYNNIATGVPVCESHSRWNSPSMLLNTESFIRWWWWIRILWSWWTKAWI